VTNKKLAHQFQNTLSTALHVMSVEITDNIDVVEFSFLKLNFSIMANSNQLSRLCYINI